MGGGGAGEAFEVVAAFQEPRAFSAKVDTGFAEENATNQKLRASDLMQSDRITL